MRDERRFLSLGQFERSEAQEGGEAVAAKGNDPDVPAPMSGQGAPTFGRDLHDDGLPDAPCLVGIQSSLQSPVAVPMDQGADHRFGYDGVLLGGGPYGTLLGLKTRHLGRYLRRKPVKERG